MPESYMTKLARWSQRRAEIHKLRSQGYTLAQIGKALRISRQRVGQIVSHARRQG